MIEIGLAGLTAIALWWASTGAILYLDGLPARTFRWSMMIATVLAAAALWGVWMTRETATPTGALIGFACGVTLWGWQAMTFYMGYITGPRTTPCPPGLTGWRRFVAAAETNITHEIAILAGALLVLSLTRDSANQLALWTYLVLWGMHLSGKINVYLGVPNLSEEFIPDHLGYLKSYMRQRPMNLLFPVSVTAATLITGWLAWTAAGLPAGSFEATSFALLATLMALGLLEHWLLVTPLPAMALWSWSLSSRTAPSAAPRSPPHAERASIAAVCSNAKTDPEPISRQRSATTCSVSATSPLPAGAGTV